MNLEYHDKMGDIGLIVFNYSTTEDYRSLWNQGSSHVT